MTLVSHTEPTSEPVGLVATGLSRRFGQLHAVEGVSLEVQPRTIVGLIGPNGAGKTTCLGLLSGVVSSNDGRVVLNGRDLSRAGPARRARAGLSRTFQHVRLVPGITCFENVMLGAQGARRHRGSRALASAAIDALRRTPLAEDQWLVQADRLAPPDRRWVEIGRVLAAGPSTVLLDEPSAGFGTEDTASLFDVIRGMRDRGLGVLLVTHDVSLAASVCDRIVAMHAGREMATGTPREILADEQVITTYLGEKGRRAAVDALARSEAHDNAVG